ncbi:MAG: hypothetical protein J6X48_05875 [Lachnospiraceae bacterium]|nr:hypothetical protein [Lachnospiraceae bacterium]
MALLYSSSNFIKWWQYKLDMEAYVNVPHPFGVPTGPIIKKWQVKMSFADKYRFGVLTYPEYLEWMQELAEEAAQEEKPKKKAESNTFWANDDGERENLSNADYEKFLAENAINVSNNTTLDIDRIINDVSYAEEPKEALTASDEFANKPPAQESEEDVEANIQAVLTQLNKDIHGDSVLTEDEIRALFEAAGN